MSFYTELEQTVLNLWYVETISVRRGVITGAKPGGWLGWSPPTKTYELTLLAMIVHNSVNIICSTKRFYHPLFCHSSVVKYTSSLSQYIELAMRIDNHMLLKSPPNLIGCIHLGSKRVFAASWKLGQKLKFRQNLTSTVQFRLIVLILAISGVTWGLSRGVKP